jgi:uncharacterized membrane protein
MWLSFSRPEFLLLLPVAAALLWYSARVSYADLSGARRWVAWVARALIVLALILALAGAQLVKRSNSMVVAFALDASYSVPAEERAKALEFIKQALKHRRPQDRGALVVFGREAAVESESLRQPDDVQVASKPSPTHTDIAAGLRLAMGILPPEAAGKLVVFSDGNENVGSASEEVLLARANGVAVDVVPLKARKARDVLVREVGVPAEARLGEPFPVRATVEATEPSQATVTVLVDDQPIERRPATLAAGTTALRIPVSLPDAGFHKVEVLVESADEQCRENDRGTGFVRVKGKPRVLVVDQNAPDAAALCKALKLQDIIVDVGGPAALPTNAADLERYDSLFLSNCPAYKMSNHQMTMLRDATRDLGIGLGMIGGEFSFGAGGYYQTPVEEALPVSMDVSKHRVFPASAVLIVMDTSGSMGMPEDGVEKIQLAAEAACAVVDLLQPYDAIGFIASDPSPTLVCALRKAANKSAVKNDIRSVRAGGGGIACYPSLSAAYDLLRKDKAAVRHVIMLADGSDCDEQEGTVPLAAQMSSQKMTVTTVAFGEGPHVPFLQQVAKEGRGHFYLTEKAGDLKKIFTRETLTIARSVLVEEQFRARLGDASPVVQGVDWGAAPPLLGYVATSPKGLAKVPLLSHKDDPVFAHWQYGLGKSVAFTSDAKAHWAAYWLGWQGFPKFWGQAVRWSLREPSSGVLYPRVEPEGDKASVVVEAVAENGSLINGLEMRATVNTPDGGRAEVVLGQTAPGRYEGRFPAAGSGAYVVGLTASGPGGFQAQQTVGFAVAYPPDFADTSPNLPFLTNMAEQTGGKTLTGPEEAFQPPKVMPAVRTDLWRSLLWLAALLLPLDVAVRRLLIRREDLAVFAQLVSAAVGRVAARREAPRPATMARLLARKSVHQASAEAPPTAPPVEIPEQRAPVSPTDRSPQPVTAEVATPEERSVQRTPAAPPQPASAEKTLARLLDRKRRQR